MENKFCKQISVSLNWVFSSLNVYLKFFGDKLESQEWGRVWFFMLSKNILFFFGLSITVPLLPVGDTI